VKQDLTLQQDKVQQRGTVLRAQVHQQRTVVCPTEERRGGETGGDERQVGYRGAQKDWGNHSNQTQGYNGWVIKGWIG
jgi:hypothetical protein